MSYIKDIEKMLQCDFGEALSEVKINITFRFFEYEKPNTKARPYIDKKKGAPKVEAREIVSYFDYLSKKPPPRLQQCLQIQQPSKVSREPFIPRDIIHNLNGWY